MEYVCALCPRQCRAPRTDRSGSGFCKSPYPPRVARAALHFDEEPCISGTRGSGTIFFSGCALKCVYCQNAPISHGNYGEDITVGRLADIMADLIAQGAHNVNLVNPTHFTPAIVDALKIYRPAVTVWNTGGYELASTVEGLAGFADVFLTDLKYCSSDLSARFSGAADYFERVSNALLAMCRVTGPAVYDSDGLMVRGVLVRHLMLPGCLDDTLNVLAWLRDNVDAPISLMAQYTPMGDGPRLGLDRPVSRREYDTAVDFLFRNGMEDGYVQELESAQTSYIPPFDLTGVR